MNARPQPQNAPAGLTARYQRARDPRQLLGTNVLAVFGFGRHAPDQIGDSRYLKVRLEPLNDRDIYEVWTVPSVVHCWEDGSLLGADSDNLSFGHVSLHEDTDSSSIRAAAEQAYAWMSRHLSNTSHRHLLRIWNYFDAINAGEGDDERYRHFCVGRGIGLRISDTELPAATAIGQDSQPRCLQVYWLSARSPGRPLENPRQTPAYRYPRRYGPKPPSFARAMASPPGLGLPLMLSGTAAVVGHHSCHLDDLAMQIAETFRNFDALLGKIANGPPAPGGQFGAESLLKIYLRRADDFAAASELLGQHLPPEVPRLFLRADICRSELLIEIDGFRSN